MSEVYDSIGPATDRADYLRRNGHDPLILNIGGGKFTVGWRDKNEKLPDERQWYDREKADSTIATDGWDS